MLEALNKSIKPPSVDYYQRAELQQKQLTKPPGSLGRLESLACQLAAMQKRDQPQINKASIVIFAADHGVVAENISAFPQAVTAQMLQNFVAGGAAISVLAKALSADLEVIDVGTVQAATLDNKIINARIATGTANFALTSAMSEKQRNAAFQVGYGAIDRAQQRSADLFIGGEMGIGNTSSASAIAAALLSLPAEQLTGPGTGLQQSGVVHKADVINRALVLHEKKLTTTANVLCCLGGFEIAALTAAYIAAAQIGLPILVDGFITSVAALAAVKLRPEVLPWMIFAHESAEPGHQLVYQALDAKPLLDLQLRLGEGSGAAVAVPLLRLACQLHNQMATFEQAGVSEKNE